MFLLCSIMRHFSLLFILYALSVHQQSAHCQAFATPQPQSLFLALSTLRHALGFLKIFGDVVSLYSSKSVLILQYIGQDTAIRDTPL